MNNPHENPPYRGAFEAREAKGMSATHEKNTGPFELEVDDTAQIRPERTGQPISDIYPERTKFIVDVAEANLTRAPAILSSSRA